MKLRTSHRPPRAHALHFRFLRLAIPGEDGVSDPGLLAIMGK